MRELIVEHCGDTTHLVRRQADNLHDRLLLREATLLFVESETGTDEIDDILLVTSVENSEGIGEAEP